MDEQNTQEDSQRGQYSPEGVEGGSAPLVVEGGSSPLFDEKIIDTMWYDPKSLVHGKTLGDGYGMPESGIREHSDRYKDRGPKLPDGTYDQKTIEYNIHHASEMIAQLFTSQKFKFKLSPYFDDSDTDTDTDKDTDLDECELPKCGRYLTGDVVIDKTSDGDTDFDELSILSFHIGETSIELALTTYGYKFEERNYDWLVIGVTDKNEDYHYGGYILEEAPKYRLDLEIV